MSLIDARLTEMQFLARLDRIGPTAFQANHSGPANNEQLMVVSLLHDGYLNDGFDEDRGIEHLDWAYQLTQRGFLMGQRIHSVLTNKPIVLKISHKGRVRLFELMQQLRTGRDRDETGLLWAKRHLETDLAVALLSASNDAPVSVVFIDMNGLKAINDAHGHPAGDTAIRAFFQAVLATLGQFGEVYRFGGDEVVVVLPKVSDEAVVKLLDGFMQQLGKDVLLLGKNNVATALTASCGSASTASPNQGVAALLEQADSVQYRAKALSKEQTPRVSASAVGSGVDRTHAPGSAEPGAAPAGA